jgi:hypothetical protein
VRGGVCVGGGGAMYDRGACISRLFSSFSVFQCISESLSVTSEMLRYTA